MRERDIRNAIQAALIATDAFDQGHVTIFGLPEDWGSGASGKCAAVIEPKSTSLRDLEDAETDGNIYGTCSITLTFMYRGEEAEDRDEGAEKLLNTAIDALNGATLVDGLTMPGFTRIKSWTWEKPEHPERRITALLEVQYLVEGWDEFDTLD